MERRRNPDISRPDSSSGDSRARSKLRGARGRTLLVAFVAIALLMAVGIVIRRGDGTATAGTGTAYSLSIVDGSPTVVRIDLDERKAHEVASLESPGEAPSVMPDMAVSPGGDRLYVAHGAAGAYRFEVLDAASGSIVDSETVADLPPVQLSDDYLSLARDERVVIFQSRVTGPGTSADSLQVYDPELESMLPERVELGLCGGVGLARAVPGWDIAVVCSIPREVRLINVSPTGGLESEEVVALPPSSLDDAETNAEADLIASASLSSDSRTFYVVTQIGRVFAVDLEQLTVEESQLGLPEDTYVAHRAALVIGDDGEMVVASGSTKSFDAFKASHAHAMRADGSPPSSSSALSQPGMRLTLTLGDAALMLNPPGTVALVLELEPRVRPDGGIPLPRGYTVDLETAAS